MLPALRIPRTTPLHLLVELVLQGWLEGVADEINNGQEVYDSVTQYGKISSTN